MADGDGGTERRIQDAAAIASMAVQIGNLAASMIRVEAGQSQLLQRLEAAEQRAADNCRNCSTWDRLRALEDFKAEMGERIKGVKDHEDRLRVIEPRMAVASFIFAALSFVAGKVF